MSLRYIKGPIDRGSLASSKAEAASAGARLYWGQDCPKGHGGVRYTRDGKCRECTLTVKGPKAKLKYRNKHRLFSRQCLHCGKMFIPNNLSFGLCSVTCKRARINGRAGILRVRQAQHRREKRIRDGTLFRACIVCGTPFEAKNGDHKYCSKAHANRDKYLNKKEAAKEKRRRARIALQVLEELGIEI